MTPVSEVWGVGHKHTLSLQRYGVTTTLQLASMVHVFIRTSAFDKAGPSYDNATTGKPISPSPDTRNILGLVTHLLDMIWKDGYRYAKAGVMLGDFCSPEHVQFDLFQ